MPELPEVTITASQLAQEMVGWRIVRYIYHDKIKYYTPIPEQALPLTVQGIWNKGKNILFNLYSSDASGNTPCQILSHMNMTGHWTTGNQRNTNGAIPHLRLTLFLECLHNGVIHTKMIYYTDVRGFGSFHFGTVETIQGMIVDVRPSILETSKEDFIRLAQSKPVSAIFTLIMDQKAVVSGVGNYVANEALYLARIAPHCLVQRLSVEQLGLLHDAICHVCNTALNNGGMSISDWYDIYDRKGKQQLQLNVYDKREKKGETDPLGNPVKNDKLIGRTVFWVPALQYI